VSEVKGTLRQKPLTRHESTSSSHFASLSVVGMQERRKEPAAAIDATGAARPRGAPPNARFAEGSHPPLTLITATATSTTSVIIEGTVHESRFDSYLLSHSWRNQAISQLCAFCSPDWRTESASLC
jgi:hypothetical protein